MIFRSPPPGQADFILRQLSAANLPRPAEPQGYGHRQVNPSPTDDSNRPGAQICRHGKQHGPSRLPAGLLHETAVNPGLHRYHRQLHQHLNRNRQKKRQIHPAQPAKQHGRRIGQQVHQHHQKGQMPPAAQNRPNLPASADRKGRPDLPVCAGGNSPRSPTLPPFIRSRYRLLFLPQTSLPQTLHAKPQNKRHRQLHHNCQRQGNAEQFRQINFHQPFLPP